MNNKRMGGAFRTQSNSSAIFNARRGNARVFVMVFVLLPFLIRAGSETNHLPINIASRVEMFVDRALIESSRNVSLQLQTPVRREVVLTLGKPWEGPGSAYFTVFQDGAKVRLYYRGFVPNDSSDKQVTCLAESNDGIQFTRPNLGLYEFNGSKENNIVYMGVEAHNFAPFLDKNPKAKFEERYKALGGINGKLMAFSSPDGLHWKKIQETPVLTKGLFDSLNVAFWNETAGCYRCYSRYWTGHGYTGHRAIQSNTSNDFLHWDDPKPNQYRGPDGATPPLEQFYTSSTTQCPGAPHIFLSMPKRFLPERTKIAGHSPGASDGVFMSSRDGVTWDRTFLEGWLRPGLDQRNWTHRNNMTACGIIVTGLEEFSLYASEHYDWPDNRLRRLSVRTFGFASVHAGAEQGEFTTPVIIFSGENLFLNYATSAAGSVQVEIQDENGRALPGFAANDMAPLFGDEIDARIAWKERGFAAWRGKAVRFRFVMKDADIFSFRTGQ